MATKKPAKKTMARKAMKKTKGGAADIFMPVDPRLPAVQVNGGIVNPMLVKGCASGKH